MKAGYFTCGIVKNPWLPARGRGGELQKTVVRRGFEYYDVGGIKLEANPLWERGIGQEKEFVAFAAPEEATDEAIEVIKAKEGRGDRRPFCLYLHYMNTHEPYSPSAGKMEAAEFENLLEARTPGLAGPRAPACGLFLVKVNYPAPFGEMFEEKRDEDI